MKKFLLVVLFIPSILLAESSPYRPTLKWVRSESISKLIDTTPDSNALVGKGKKLVTIDPIRLRTHIRGIGNVEFSFSRVKEKTWPAMKQEGGRFVTDQTKVRLLTGLVRMPTRGARSKARGPSRSYRIATGSYIDDAGTRSLNITFNQPRPYGSGARFLRLKGTIRNKDLSSELQLSSAPALALFGPGHPCGHGVTSAAELVLPAAETNEGGDDGQGGSPITSPATLKTIEMRFAIDTAAQALLGSSASALVADFANTVDTIYQSQLDLALDIKSITVGTSTTGYPSSDSGDILEYFADNSSGLGSADATQLISGVDFTSSVIGLAYSGTCSDGNGNFTCDCCTDQDQNGLCDTSGTTPLSCNPNALCGTTGDTLNYGVLCNRPDLAYSIVQHFNSSLTYAIMAHELGHNLGALHFTSGVMTVSLDPSSPPTAFSTCNDDQITAFVASGRASCLTETDGSTSSSSSSSSASSGSSSSSGGGGSGGGVTPVDPTISLSVTFKNSTLKAITQYSSTHSNCLVKILAAPSAAKLATDPTEIVATQVSADFGGLSYRKKRLKSISKKGQKISFQAQVTGCSTGTDASSAVKSVNVSTTGRAANTVKNKAKFLAQF